MDVDGLSGDAQPATTTSVFVRRQLSLRARRGRGDHGPPPASPLRTFSTNGAQSLASTITSQPGGSGTLTDTSSHGRASSASSRGGHRDQQGRSSAMERASSASAIHLAPSNYSQGVLELSTEDGQLLAQSPRGSPNGLNHGRSPPGLRPAEVLARLVFCFIPSCL